MKILIVDDEPVARQVLRELIEECPDVELVGEARSGQEAVEQVMALDPDVVLLDLQMPGLDGFAVTRKLRGRPLPLVIFVTAFERHALKAFETEAVDYLLKPVRRERLEKAFTKARARLIGLRAIERSLPAPPEPAWQPRSEPLRRIVGRASLPGGRSETEMHLLDPEEVVAFQADGDVVIVHSRLGRYLSDLSLSTLIDRLPGSEFRRIHRSTIINTNHIRTILPLSSRRWMLRMSNGLEVIVSKRMAAQVREMAGW